MNRRAADAGSSTVAGRPPLADRAALSGRALFGGMALVVAIGVGGVGASSTGVGASGAAASTARAGPTPHAGVAFELYADAFPAEPAAGLNGVGVPARATATRAKVANPPSDAYARAAAVDTGIAEAYLGKQGPDAEVDTADSAGPTERRYEQDGLSLQARADRSPRAAARASGHDTAAGELLSRSSTSTSASDGVGDRLVAHATAAVSDLSIGVLRLGFGRFEATASVTGRPGGARAEGRIITGDVTVSGVPVVIDATGVHVDQTKVPLPQVGVAADAVRRALSQGGYSEVRILQPALVVAPDGSSATVGGGGVFVKLATGDPKNDYFATFTLLGGSARAAIGGSVIDAGAPLGQSLGQYGGRSELPAGSRPALLPAPGALLTPNLPGAPAVSDHGGALGGFDDVGTAARYRLRSPWAGWPWLVAVVVGITAGWRVLGLAGLAKTRHRIERVADAAADRYLRG